jgi:predicted metal-dependent phosphoesterase TrpH/glycosyltransferase involved in cell wall biosynthesis
MNDQSICVRVDLHCHSDASSIGQDATALAECATPPHELYELAKRRGMDFVTITDHDTIAGALELAHLPDAFVSVELTAAFKGEPHAVHVLCYGIAPDDHEWLQAHKEDVVACAGYLHEHELAAALAHPFWPVREPLTGSHRRILAELFPVWETRNGKRPAAVNAPAAIYVETHGAGAVGGSDDHGGLDIGRTFTEAPAAASVAELLGHIRGRRTASAGKQGIAAEWAHSGIAIALRTLGDAADASAGVTPELLERILVEGDRHHGSVLAGLDPRERATLVRSWCEQLEFDPRRFDEPEFSHAGLELRARRAHERALAAAGWRPEALVPALPYITPRTFLARECARIAGGATGEERARVALIADGRKAAAPGYEVDLLELRSPSLFDVTEALTARRYDLVHVCGSSAVAASARSVARLMSAALVDWQFWVDLERFGPSHFAPAALPAGAFDVLYAGPLERAAGLDLLATAFLAARERDPRLRLVIAGHGSEEERLQRRLGAAALFLGVPDQDALANVFASAELLVSPAPGDAVADAILAAQASGLPVLAVDSELVEHGRTGCVVPADPEQLADALRGLAKRGALRERLATGGLLAVRNRPWETKLAGIYARALGTEIEVSRAA